MSHLLHQMRGGQVVSLDCTTAADSEPLAALIPQPRAHSPDLRGEVLASGDDMHAFREHCHRQIITSMAYRRLQLWP